MMDESNSLKRLSKGIVRQASRKLNSQKAPRLTPSPPKLEELLRVINLVPFNRDLPSLKEVEIFIKLQAPHKEIQIASWLRAVYKRADETSDRFRALCQVIVDLRSEDFGEYILGSKKLLRAWVPTLRGEAPKTSSVRGDQMSEAIDRYNEFRHIQMLLKRVMLLSASRKEYEASDVIGEFRFLGSLHLGSLHIDKNDELYIEPASFIKVLLHDGVKVSRIRKCANKNCQRVFWAGRANMMCCSVAGGKLTGCSHAYRNQQYRERNKELAGAPESKKTKLTEHEKLKRVLDAILGGSRTEGAIAKETSLQSGEVSRLAIKLFDRGEVDLQDLNGEPEYFAVKAKKKGR